MPPDDHVKKISLEELSSDEKLPELKAVHEPEQRDQIVQLHGAEDPFEEQRESRPLVTKPQSVSATQEEAHVQPEPKEQQENTNLYYLPSTKHIVENWGISSSLKIFFAFLPTYILFTSPPFIPAFLRDFVDFQLEPVLWGALIFFAHLQLAWSYSLWQACRMANICSESSTTMRRFSPRMAGSFGLFLGPLTAPLLVLILSAFIGPVFEHNTGTIACELVGRAPVLVLALVCAISFGPLFLAALAYNKFFRYCKGVIESKRLDAGASSVVEALQTAGGLMLPAVIALWFIEGNFFQWPNFATVAAIQLVGYIAAFAGLRVYYKPLREYMLANKLSVVDAASQAPDGGQKPAMTNIVESLASAAAVVVRVSTVKWCAIGFAIALLFATMYGRTQLYLADSSLVSSSQKEALFDAAIAADPGWSRPYVRKAKWLATQNRKQDALKAIGNGYNSVKSTKGLERLKEIRQRLEDAGAEAPVR